LTTTAQQPTIELAPWQYEIGGIVLG